MELSELKVKFDELKTRITKIETQVTIANTKREQLIKKLNDDFGIKPEEVKPKLESMKKEIDQNKEDLIKLYKELEEHVTNAEKQIDG